MPNCLGSDYRFCFLPFLVSTPPSLPSQALVKIIREDIPILVKNVRILWRLHHLTWLATNKPFGLETLEQRYGGLVLRLDSLRFRLQAFVDGDVQDIPELDEKLLKIYTVDITKSDPKKRGGWPVFDECHARTVSAASPMQARRYCWP